MKVELCVIGALILLSSITSIFNNLVVEDASAQPMEKVAYGYDQSYNDDGYAAKNSYNNMDDKYSKHPSQDNKYECQRGPFQGFFVESVEFCNPDKFDDDRKDHADKKIFKCGPETNNAGALVTDLRLCEAPNDDNICPEGTDLEGVYVKDPTSDCDIDSPDIPTSADLQCLKCADLAAISAGGTKQLADALIGSTTANVFTVCDDTDPRTALADLLIAEEVGTGPANMLNEAFDTCLDNAAAVTSGTSSSAQTQASSLQENSMTTNIQSEAEIPSLNTEPQNAN
jgi:hypothetical protein